MFVVSVIGSMVLEPSVLDYVATAWSGLSLIWAVSSEWVDSWHAAVQTSGLKRVLLGTNELFRELLAKYDPDTESIPLQMTTSRAKHPTRRLKGYDFSQI